MQNAHFPYLKEKMKTREKTEQAEQEKKQGSWGT